MPREHDIDFQGSFFALEVDGLKIAHFTACSGLSLEFASVEFKTVTIDGKALTIKRPGKPGYSEVVLKRGFTQNMDVYKWFDEVVESSKPTPYKTAAIIIYDRNAKEVARFDLHQCWPSKLSVSDLNANSDEVMVEELTIQHEFLDWV